MTLGEITRIGGEMELRLADFGQAASCENWPAPAVPCKIWTDTGRSALFLAASSHAARRGRKLVHLPAFSCFSVTEPFVAAGYDVIYYDHVPNDANLDLPALAEGDLLVVLHYFGVPNAHIDRLVKLARDFGCAVLEDFVQASLNVKQPVKGDYVVTSLRKFLPVTDGAFLGSRNLVSVALDPSDETFVSRRLAAKMLRAVTEDVGLYLSLIEETEDSLAAARPRMPSAAAGIVMGTMDLDRIARRRRENWHALNRAMIDIPSELRPKTVTDFPGVDDVPLGYAVSFDNGIRDQVRAALREEGIYCPIHWDLSHLAEGAFPKARDLSSRIMTIPLDQRYDAAQMQAVAGRLLAVLTRLKHIKL